VQNSRRPASLLPPRVPTSNQVSQQPRSSRQNGRVGDCAAAWQGCSSTCYPPVLRWRVASRFRCFPRLKAAGISRQARGLPHHPIGGLPPVIRLFSGGAWRPGPVLPSPERGQQSPANSGVAPTPGRGLTHLLSTCSQVDGRMPNPMLNAGAGGRI
jgi:hypothetical protein